MHSPWEIYIVFVYFSCLVFDMSRLTDLSYTFLRHCFYCMYFLAIIIVLFTCLLKSVHSPWRVYIVFVHFAYLGFVMCRLTKLSLTWPFLLLSLLVLSWFLYCTFYLCIYTCRFTYSLLSFHFSRLFLPSVYLCADTLNYCALLLCRCFYLYFTFLLSFCIFHLCIYTQSLYVHVKYITI